MSKSRFTDLSSGNISYKMAQRVAGFVPVAIVTGGADRVVFDMSRGEKHRGIHNTMVTAVSNVKDRNCQLVLNCGSSSVKYKLYDMDNGAVLAEDNVKNVSDDPDKGLTHEQAIEAIRDAARACSIGYRAVISRSTGISGYNFSIRIPS